MQSRRNRILLAISVVIVAAAVSSGRSDLAKRAVGQPEKLEPGEVSAASMANEKILVTSGCKLVLLDRESKAILWESSGLHGAYSVAVLSAGGFLVGEGKSVAHVDQEGRVSSRAAAKFQLTTDVKPLENGRMLVSDGQAGTVVEMDWSGAITWSLRGLHHPSEAVRLENGDTLIADGTAQLKRFDANGKLVGSINLQRWAASVQKVSGGTLVGQREAVELLDDTGQPIWSLRSTSRVTGVEQLPSGEFLICEPDANRIAILDAAGHVTWEATGLNSPWQATLVR